MHRIIRNIRDKIRRMEGGNVLFNNALDTFLFIVLFSDHAARTTHIMKENQLPPCHRLFFPVRQEGIF